MIKINKSHFILLTFFVITLIAISSCTKQECKTSADCKSRTCFLSKCESQKCVYTLQRNCCGNRLNESIENGKPGSKCTCPQDYGKCEGIGQIKIGSRIEDATYVRYLCNADNRCILGVDKKDVVPQNFLDVLQTGFFKASLVVRYNKPFDVSEDSFDFRVSLDDASTELLPPARLTKVKLLYSSEFARAEQLIAEKELDNTLNGIGDEAIFKVPINLNYRPQELEERGSVRYSLDYAYTKLVPSGKTLNGTSIYVKEPVRATFTSPVKQVFLVRSG